MTFATPSLLPMMNAAAPAAAEYSSASPGAPCDVSAPMASPYSMALAVDEPHAHEHGLGAGLARELEVGAVAVSGVGADGLGDHGPGRLDRVRMRLGTDVDRADLLRVDPALDQARFSSPRPTS